MGWAEERREVQTGPTGRLGVRRKTSDVPIRLDGPVPSTLGPDTVRTIQRKAGNRAAVSAVGRLVAQRKKPAPAPPPVPGPTLDGPGRPPSADEHADWDGVVPDNTWWVLRSAEDGYNCFAWAVGETSFILTYAMVEAVGTNSHVDGFTKYLDLKYGFGRSADGIDESADLILYGDSPTQVLHAARRADAPNGPLTFSSKIGGGVKPTPVILHAPADIQSNLYGHALRSFWKGAASPATGAVPTPAP